MYDPKKTMTAVLIHSFAVAHAATAALLAPTLVGDEAALTVLTIAMVIAVAKLNGADWDTGSALAFLGVMAGTYLGTRGAVFLVKWIPGIGSIANAATTTVVTEILGWSTYLFVKKGLSPETTSEATAKAIYNEAKNLRNEVKDEGEKAYESMSNKDKNEFDNIMKELKNKDLPDSTREYLTNRMISILEKYK